MTNRSSMRWLQQGVTAALLAFCAAAQANPQAKALLAEAEAIRDKNTLAAWALVQRALPLLQSPSDAKLRGDALVLRCWMAQTSEPRQALPSMAEDLAWLGRQAGLAALRVELRLCEGYGHERAQRPHEAMAAYEEAVAESQRLGDKALLADALVLRGEWRYGEGEYVLALADLKRSYDLNRELKRADKLSYALNAIANLYADANVGEYAKALDYYLQLQKEHQLNGRPQELSTNHFNIASTYERLRDWNAALEHFRLSAEMDRKRQQPLEAAYAQRSIGIVLGKQGRAAEALKVLQQALAEFEAASDADRAAQTRLSRAVVLRQLGRAREALADLNSVRGHFEQEGNERFLEKIADERAQALASVGDLQAALQAREQQLALVRSLTDKAKALQTSRLRVQFDTERKEQENRELSAENAARAQALLDADQILRWQAAAIALGATALLALMLLGWRQRRHARRMRDLAMTDELTRLPNRRHLLMLAEAQIAAARAGAGELSLLTLDIDHFKRVNDSFGHEAGDRVLQRVSAACQAVLRRSDSLGRTGGEEFVALLPGIGVSAALEIAERMREAAARTPLDDIAPGLQATVSVGLSQLRPQEREIGALLRRADAALYRAKAAGRNRVETFAEETDLG
ncbi:diguanylate cyclase [Pelomonas sp. SE-A7]|uniref:diguanylate cyclase n=1 Tax=Pelomonas sp. SE-A7 TaxID=3054953 RepID=UPI00259CA039|nr:diguanylate cyclase [Pelomonas sp. SE-A7]MDM4766058.1 diguanylate cyclase [Pelomonas sp. SE-A7]